MFCSIGIPIIIYKMRFIEKDPSSKRKYSRISFKKRQILVEEVCIKEIELTSAARKLGIGESTARTIIKKYRETGKFHTKNFKNKRNTDLGVQKTSPSGLTSNNIQEEEGTPISTSKDQSREDNLNTIDNTFQTYSYPNFVWVYYLPYNS